MLIAYFSISMASFKSCYTSSASAFLLSSVRAMASATKARAQVMSTAWAFLAVVIVSSNWLSYIWQSAILQYITACIYLPYCVDLVRCTSPSASWNISMAAPNSWLCMAFLPYFIYSGNFCSSSSSTLLLAKVSLPWLLPEMNGFRLWRFSGCTGLFTLYPLTSSADSKMSLFESFFNWGLYPIPATDEIRVLL